MALGISNLENVTIESSESVATTTLEWASDTGGTPLDAAATEKFMDCILQVSIAFHASATLGAELHLRYSSDGGTTEDTPEVRTFATSLDVDAGSTVIFSYSVFGTFSYLDVGVKNLDTAQTLTWSAIYSGSKMTGLVSS